MSKRVRGAARPHRRPGTRPSSERTGVRRRPSSPATVTSQLEIAADVAEDILEEERPATPRAAAERTARPVHARPKIKAGSLLAARAATEYVYVAQDIRRIGFVAGGLIGLLVVLWVLLVVLRVIPLPFY